MNRRLLYDELTADVTIRMILAPLGRDFDTSDRLQDVAAEFDDGDAHDGSYHLVRDSGELIGVCSSSDIDIHHFIAMLNDEGASDVRTVGKIAFPIRSISVNTPFREAVHLFAAGGNTPCVSHDGQLVGVLAPCHLYHPRALFCYLGLSLDLETAALDLCTYFPHVFYKLRQNRLSRAVRMYEQNQYHIHRDHWEGMLSGDQPLSPGLKRWVARAVMQCTQLIDKRTMIQEGRLLRRQDDERVARVFNSAKVLRDTCVHPFASSAAHPDRLPIDPGDLLGMTPQDISEFVKDSLGIIESICRVIDRRKSRNR